MAQTWLDFVLIASTLPLIIASLLGVHPSLSLMVVPNLNQHLLITEVMRNEALDIV